MLRLFRQLNFALEINYNEERLFALGRHRCPKAKHSRSCYNNTAKFNFEFNFLDVGGIL